MKCMVKGDRYLSVTHISAYKALVRCLWLATHTHTHTHTDTDTQTSACSRRVSQLERVVGMGAADDAGRVSRKTVEGMFEQV